MSTDTVMDIKKRVRREWPDALKREIVSACSVPGTSVSAVARHYDVNANLVFTWRKLYGKSQEVAATQLLPVVVTPDPCVAAPAKPVAAGIEIDLPGGYRVRCGQDIESAALRLILDALKRR